MISDFWNSEIQTQIFRFIPLFSALRGSEGEESMCVSSVSSPFALPYGAGGGESMCFFVSTAIALRVLRTATADRRLIRGSQAEENLYWPYGAFDLFLSIDKSKLTPCDADGNSRTSPFPGISCKYCLQSEEDFRL